MRSPHQIAPKMGVPSSANPDPPLIEFVTAVLPKVRAFVEILKHNLSLPFFQKLFSQHHIRIGEGTACLSRFQQAAFCLFQVSLLKGNPAKHQVSVVEVSAIDFVLLLTLL